MNDLLVLNGVLTLVNVVLVGVGVKIFSELVKWDKLKRH